MTLDDCLTLFLSWRRTGRPETPYAAEAGGRRLLLRLNDFPAEPMYTLLVEGREAGDFDDWPAAWRRPG